MGRDRAVAVSRPRTAASAGGYRSRATGPKCGTRISRRRRAAVSRSSECGSRRRSRRSGPAASRPSRSGRIFRRRGGSRAGNRGAGSRGPGPGSHPRLRAARGRRPGSASGQEREPGISIGAASIPAGAGIGLGRLGHRGGGASAVGAQGMLSRTGRARAAAPCSASVGAAATGLTDGNVFLLSSFWMTGLNWNGSGCP